MLDARDHPVRFPTATKGGEVRGIARDPLEGPPVAALVVAHGRSNDMSNPLVRRVAHAAADRGLWTLRFNFRYVDAKSEASRDLRAEEDDLRGAVRFVRSAVGTTPIFAAGKSMGARVCAWASSDPEVAGVIALGYPLHPRFRPEVMDPPEWPMLGKPTLFVQGDHDPFCDLGRLRGELPKLPQPHELVVVPNAGHSFEPIGGKRDTFPEVRAAVLGWIDSRLGHASQ